MKKAGWRMAGIGIFHMVLYLYLVPFIIYPRFGNNGIGLTVVFALVVSVAVLGTWWAGRNKNS